MTTCPSHPRGLYAITSPTSDTPELLAWAEAVIEGGAIWLQYRDKSLRQDVRRRQAEALASLCRSRHVRFLVNDDVDLALACGADGVHLGRDDPALADARDRLGCGRCIGVSCYDDIGRAERLAQAGADYLAFGAFHPSASKPQARPAAPERLAQARRLGLPVVAIGGITPDNGESLIQAGADLLAVIGGLAGPPAAARDAAHRYAHLFSTFSPQTPP